MTHLYILNEGKSRYRCSKRRSCTVVLQNEMANLIPFLVNQPGLMVLLQRQSIEAISNLRQFEQTMDGTHKV